jgi:hypothetical protein
MRRAVRRTGSALLLLLSLAAACGGKVEPGCYVYDDQKCVNGACNQVGDLKCHALCDASTPCSDPNDYCALVPLFEGRSYCSTQTATFCIGKDAGVPTDCIK